MTLDQYIVGVEHEILHLLYSRFFVRAIDFKNKNFNLKEPFKGLFTQGMVYHQTFKDNNNNWLTPDEVYSENGKDYFRKNNLKERRSVGPSECMSKSKKNTIEPGEMVAAYGAEAVRVFVVSVRTPAKEIQGSDSGMNAS